MSPTRVATARMPSRLRAAVARGWRPYRPMQPWPHARSKPVAEDTYGVVRARIRQATEAVAGDAATEAAAGLLWWLSGQPASAELARSRRRGRRTPAGGTTWARRQRG